jgi:hypothetical protein
MVHEPSAHRGYIMMTRKIKCWRHLEYPVLWRFVGSQAEFTFDQDEILYLSKRVIPISLFPISPLFPFRHKITHFAINPSASNRARLFHPWHWEFYEGLSKELVYLKKITFLTICPSDTRDFSGVFMAFCSWDFLGLKCYVKSGRLFHVGRRYFGAF